MKLVYVTSALAAQCAMYSALLSPASFPRPIVFGYKTYRLLMVRQVLERKAMAFWHDWMSQMSSKAVACCYKLSEVALALSVGARMNLHHDMSAVGMCIYMS